MYSSTHKAERCIPKRWPCTGSPDEFLTDKPVFSQVVEEMSALFDGAKWVAHNASFDMGFINAEYARLGLSPVDPGRVIDTLALARRRHPMGPNSLDALCKRYGIDNSHRTKHGALLDAELLAEVYIEMNGGRQAVLGLVQSIAGVSAGDGSSQAAAVGTRPDPLPPRLTAEETAAHQALIERLGGSALWKAYSG